MHVVKNIHDQQEADLPMLSVVLTVYNMEACLSECLDSLIEQTYSDFEVICIDDGSQDSSLDILQRYAEQDKRLLVFTQENAGPAQARNAGLSMAHGTYVMLLDSDDIFEDSLFEKMILRAESMTADVVVCRSCEFDHETRIQSATDWAVKMDRIPDTPSFSALDMKGCVFYAFTGWPWDKLYRLSFLQEQNLNFPDIKNSEDLLFVYLSLVKAQRISVIDEVLIRHRGNRKTSVSNSRLESPLAFYEGIDLLKRELMKNEKTYRILEWGFLNWAFDYTCWNIFSLPSGEVRKSLVEKLFTGGFPALELSDHVLEYYSLDVLALKRYQVLKREHQGKAPRTSFWAKVESVAGNLARNGFRQTSKKVASRLKKNS